ncbi:uncharacterized protein EI90DRAFT_3021550 [Cantharellus anzutake]|uniref:uncharacterized protein n=1 Tax=Cantharellus anzutake TaxID=1750568 RepID=UPI0019056F2D|nr:uncharacterized protein EI90DRAFT_3021550 [Cantharellus anzutake]KAF8316465.1 hypothetical protein EI90DRAFT_3021550 [Cantharellus anzutake]
MIARSHERPRSTSLSSTFAKPVTPTEAEYKTKYAHCDVAWMPSHTQLLQSWGKCKAVVTSWVMLRNGWGIARWDRVRIREDTRIGRIECSSMYPRWDQEGISPMKARTMSALTRFPSKTRFPFGHRGIRRPGSAQLPIRSNCPHANWVTFFVVNKPKQSRQWAFLESQTAKTPGYGSKGATAPGRLWNLITNSHDAKE